MKCERCSSVWLVRARAVRRCHTYSLNHHSIYGVRKFAAMCSGAKTQNLNLM